MTAVRTVVLPMLLVALHSASAGNDALQTTPVQYRVLPQERAFDAVLEAVQQSTVAAQTSGRITDIRFDVNDFVEKGEVVLTIDDTTQREQLNAAQADLREAEARHQEAQAEFARIEEIYGRKLVSKADLDRASADLKAARARLQAAQARERQAREQLDYTVLRAPYSGIVTKRHVELGETVNPGQPLMTGFSLELMRAAASVPQTLVEAVRARNRARVMLTSLDNRLVEATAITVFPFADPITHTFTVRATLPPAPSGLYPGMFAKVIFEVGEERRLLVPSEALVYRSEVVGVYVVNDAGQVALRQLRIGRPRLDGTMTEVLAGLETGEQVAVDPIAAGAYLKEHQAGAGND